MYTLLNHLIFERYLKIKIMKKVLLTCALLLIAVVSIQAQEKESHTVTVTISGMNVDNGNVYVGLYNSEATFLATPYKGAIAKVSDKKATATFRDLSKGVYAVSVYHDENNNKKMDTNFIGIPKEPIGCSNGAKGFMGPPKYKNAKFKVNKNMVIPVEVE